MTQYLLSVWGTDGEPEPAGKEIEQAYADTDALNTELRDAGAWVFAGGLHPREAATTVRLRDGEPVSTDGPFAETKEHLGGFWVIEAADLDAALDWARRAAVACGSPVEVRPFQDDAG